VGRGARAPYSAAPRGARYAGPLYPAPRGGAGQEGGGSGGTLRAGDRTVRKDPHGEGVLTVADKKGHAGGGGGLASSQPNRRV